MPALPKQIQNVAGKELHILWDDGHKSSYTYRLLRQRCPCALCRDEWSGKQLLDAESVPADLSAKKLEPVGNYAISILFSDGHATGVYSFEFLRQLN